MHIVLKSLAIPVLLLVACAAAAVFAPAFVTFFTGGAPITLVVAAIVGVLLGLFSGRLSFYRTFEHELTHLLFAMLCLQRPQRLVVAADGAGEAAYTGNGNFLISLAPYFFPLYAALFFGIATIADGAYREALLASALAALTCHPVAVLHELRVRQPDITQHGVAFSFAFIAGIGIPLFGALWLYAAGGPDAAAGYLVATGETAYNFAHHNAIRLFDLLAAPNLSHANGR